MGFFRDQRNKWRMRHNSSRQSEDSPSELAEVTLEYRGGPLGLKLQRAKSKWVDEVGPTKIVWHKERRLGITFHERDDGSIVIKELSDGMTRPDICIGQGLIGINGSPIAGMELSMVMDSIRKSSSPCELDFTPPPSPIVVADVTNSRTSGGVSSGHVLISVNGKSMIGGTLQDASQEIEGATEAAPAVLQFAPLSKLYRSASSSDAPKSSSSESLRGTVCVASVLAVLAV